jgi:hypothetical protein
MARKGDNNRQTNGSGNAGPRSSGKTFNHPTGKAARNDTVGTSPIVQSSARVLEELMRARGLTDKGLADAIHAELGYSVSDETIRSKRIGKTMMSLPQMEDFARILNVPMVLFIQPISETMFHLGRELQELESMRQARRNQGRDQGIRDSGWNPGSPACDPEIGNTVGLNLVGVGL